jgi:hypothetical protein
MQRAILAVSALALGVSLSTAARADFAVVRFADGRCQVWWDSTTNPWGAGWSKIAMGLPDRFSAQAVLANALAQAICR